MTENEKPEVKPVSEEVLKAQKEQDEMFKHFDEVINDMKVYEEYINPNFP